MIDPQKPKRRFEILDMQFTRLGVPVELVSTTHLIEINKRIAKLTKEVADLKRTIHQAA